MELQREVAERESGRKDEERRAVRRPSVFQLGGSKDASVPNWTRPRRESVADSFNLPFFSLPSKRLPEATCAADVAAARSALPAPPPAQLDLPSDACLLPLLEEDGEEEFGCR